MAIFNRKQNSSTTGMPEEVNQYYQGERRDKTWLAWLLGLATLIVTILVAVMIYYGGRWVYRKTVNKPDVAVTTQQESAPNTDTTSTATDTEDSSSSSESSPNTPEAEPETEQNDSVNSTRPGDLPSTGPADTFAIFIAVSVLGYVVHRKYVSSK